MAPWSRAGLVGTGAPYTSTVKPTLAKGASLADPSGPFDASPEGRTRRAIARREADDADGAPRRRSPAPS